MLVILFELYVHHSLININRRFYMRNLSKIMTSFVLALAMIFSLSTTVLAAETNMSQSSETVKSGLTDKVISKADPYIALDNEGVFVISDYESLSQKLTVAEFQLVKKQITNINAQVLQSKSDLDQSVVVDYRAKSVSFYSLTSSPRRAKSKYKEGVTKITWKWYGARIYLSKTIVNHILKAGVNAGSAYITGKIPGTGIAIATAVAGYIISEFGTHRAARAIYVDVGLTTATNPLIIGIRKLGFQ